jgi:hypothetical protein
MTGLFPEDSWFEWKFTVAYAERGDANSQVKGSSVGTLLNVRRVPVPTSRARLGHYADCASASTQKR